MIEFWVNEKLYEIEDSKGRKTLLSLLRDNGVNDVKRSCEEGICGACSIIRSNSSGEQDALSACSLQLILCGGYHFYTAAYLTDKNPEISKAMSSNFASQCGFCTPGMATKIYQKAVKNKKKALKIKGSNEYSESSSLTEDSYEDEAEDTIKDNLCRCTGYRPILQSCKDACQKYATCVDIEDIGKKCGNKDEKLIKDESVFLDDVVKFEDSEIINGGTGFLPTAGCHEPFSSRTNSNVLNLQQYPELKNLWVRLENGHQILVIGGAVTIQTFIEKAVELNSNLAPLANHFSKIGSKAVRTAGTIAGNLILGASRTDSFHSDILPIFTLLNAEYVYLQTENHGDLKLHGVMKSLNKIDASTEGILYQIKIRIPQSTDHVFLRKIINRSGLSLSNYSVVGLGDREMIKVIFSGMSMSGGTKMLEISPSDFALAFDSKPTQIFDSVFDSSVDAVSKKISYGEYFRFWSNFNGNSIPALASKEKQYSIKYENMDGSSYDTIQEVNANSQIRKDGELHPTGTIKYTSDATKSKDTAHLAFILAEKLGQVEMIELDLQDGEQLIMPEDIEAAGFLNISRFTKGDPDSNGINIDSVAGSLMTEPILAKSPKYIGAPVAIVASSSRDRSLLLSETAKIRLHPGSEYKGVYSFDEAIEKGKLFIPEFTIVEKGSFGENEGLIKVEGEVDINAQTHWYLEPFSAHARGDDGRMSIEISTQHVMYCQEAVAYALQMNQSDVAVHVRRLGGAFGGKGAFSGWIACCAGIGNKMTGKDSSLEIPLSQSQKIMGGRPGFKTKYTAYVTPDGVLKSLDCTLFIDCGSSSNDAYGYASFCLNTFRACGSGPYNIENLRWKCQLIETNKQPITYMRAPGEMAPLYSLSRVMEHIGRQMKKEPTDIKYLNLLRKGNSDSVNYVEPCDRVHDTWQLVSPIYEQFKSEAEAFNASNEYKKCGVAMTPQRARWTNNFVYGGVTLIIGRYDGSVVLHSFAHELGNGSHTRTAQIVAENLGVDFEKIALRQTSTDALANCNETGGSYAGTTAMRLAKKAAVILKNRLEPYRKDSWYETVRAAHTAGISLQETVLGNNMNNEDGTAVYYWYGCSVAMVEIDSLSGESKVRKFKQVMDTGDPVNKALNLGQVEGGIIMGLGHYKTEKLTWDENGHVNELCGAYTIPTAADLPDDWSITMTNDMSGLNPSNENKPPIRSKWAAEFGQHASLVIVPAAQAAINAFTTNNSNIVNSPIIPSEVIKCFI